MSLRNDWTKEEIEAIYNKPLLELIYEAATIHRKNNDPSEVQVSTLLSIKTGGCPENCSYCPQSIHHNTDLEPERLLSLDEVMTKASIARQNGSTRFCMGAAWRNVKITNNLIVLLTWLKELIHWEWRFAVRLACLPKNKLNA